MGLITRIEDKIGNLVETPFQYGDTLDPVRIEIALKRYIEGHRKPFCGKIFVYPAYTILLNEQCYIDNEPFLVRLKEVLKSDIDIWLREKGYEAIHPINIQFKKVILTDQPFEVQISKTKEEVIQHLLHIQSRLMYPLHSPITVIGRGEQCHILLDNETISREHARITFKKNKYTLADLSSKNGTRVNQKRVSEIQLFDGDKILFGSVSFKCCFTTKNVSYGS